MSKLTVAGTEFSPKKTKLSMIETSSKWRVALLPFLLTDSASSGTWMVQNSPESAMSALKSCTWSPELGSKRSIHMNANVPCRTEPSPDTYVPLNTRMSVAMV